MYKNGVEDLVNKYIQLKKEREFGKIENMYTYLCYIIQLWNKEREFQIYFCHSLPYFYIFSVSIK